MLDFRLVETMDEVLDIALVGGLKSLGAQAQALTGAEKAADEAEGRPRLPH